jgi:hypothetical protein
MSSPTDFTVMKGGPDKYDLERFTFNEQPVFVRDVKPGEKMWLIFTKNQQGNKTGIAFHIQSIDSIEGTGWDHGKFGKGATVPVN